MGYENGKIYKIVSNGTDLVYVGSTTQPLCKRMAQHRDDFNRWKKGKRHFQTSFDVLKCDDSSILLIEDYSCERKEQLTAREGYWIRELNCVNKIIPGQTHKEWRESNKEKISTKKKQYRENNKEKILEYREDNKEKYLEKFDCEVCGGKYTYTHKQHHYNSKKHQKALQKQL